MDSLWNAFGHQSPPVEGCPAPHAWQQKSVPANNEHPKLLSLYHICISIIYVHICISIIIIYHLHLVLHHVSSQHFPSFGFEAHLFSFPTICNEYSRKTCFNEWLQMEWKKRPALTHWVEWGHFALVSSFLDPTNSFDVKNAENLPKGSWLNLSSQGWDWLMWSKVLHSPPFTVHTGKIWRWSKRCILKHLSDLPPPTARAEWKPGKPCRLWPYLRCVQPHSGGGGGDQESGHPAPKVFGVLGFWSKSIDFWAF